MKRTKLVHLMHAYFSNTIQAKDCEELLAYIYTADEDEISSAIDEVNINYKTDNQIDDKTSSIIFNKINLDPRFQKTAIVKSKKYHPKRRWYYAAASIFILIAVALFAKYNRNLWQPIPKGNQANKRQFIIPGSDKAILSLGKNELVVLDSARNVNISINGTKIKQKNGLLAYKWTENTSISKIPVINKLSTPKGGKFQLILDDGTKIWLNAASSISYPSVFEGKERQVELEGEAYFEVAKDPERPFKIKVNHTEIQVLGTHFNVKAYNDEDATSTTLLEGAVKIKVNNKSHLLAPGEQAYVSNVTGETSIKQVDVDKVIAWKNGLFSFQGEDIKTIMKKVARWYDVEIEYHGEVSNQLYVGTSSCNKPFKELLQNLEMLGSTTFKVEGRRVIVME